MSRRPDAGPFGPPAGPENTTPSRIPDWTAEGPPVGNARDALRALERRYAERGRLFLVHLDLTWRCPLSCPHCYLGDRRSDELDTADWLALLDEARDLQVAEVVLSGGDPMVRPDFTTLLEGARSRGFAVLVKTTGLRLSGADADRFADLSWVLADISLHSTDPALHDAFVGRKGAWRKAVDAIDALRTRGIPVRIARSLVEGIGDDGGALWAWAHARGLRLTESTSILSRRDGLAAGRAGLDESTQVSVVLRHLADRPPENPRVPDPSAPPCAAGRTRLYVTPAGEITPCVAWPRRVGHVREGGLQAALSSRALEQVRSLRQGDRHGCDGCDLRPTCDFCPGQAEILAGRPDAPYPGACSRARVLAEALRRHRAGRGGAP